MSGSNIGPVQSMMIEHLDTILTRWELTLNYLDDLRATPGLVNVTELIKVLEFEKESLERWRKMYPRSMVVRPKDNEISSE